MIQFRKPNILVVYQMNSSYKLEVIWINDYLTGLDRKARLDLHGKVEKI